MQLKNETTRPTIDSSLAKLFELEAKLGASEIENKRYKQIVCDAPMGVMVLHMDDLEDLYSFRLTMCNPAASVHTGFLLVNKIGMFVNDIFPNFVDSGLPAKYQKMIKDRKPVQFDNFRYEDDAHKGIWQIYAFPMNGQDVVVFYQREGINA